MSMVCVWTQAHVTSHCQARVSLLDVNYCLEAEVYKVAIPSLAWGRGVFSRWGRISSGREGRRRKDSEMEKQYPFPLPLNVKIKKNKSVEGGV